MDRRQKTILIVEDNKDHIELIRYALNKLDHAYNVVFLEDGQDALDYIYRKGSYSDNRQYSDPSLILLDIKLPSIDGFEVLKTLKQHSDKRYIPVVMLTTSEALDDLKRSMSLGANDYVIKPINYADFQEKIRIIGDYWMSVSDTHLLLEEIFS